MNFQLLVMLLIALSFEGHSRAVEPPQAESRSQDETIKKAADLTAMIRTEMAEKYGYNLKPDRVLCRVAPPYAEIRDTYFKVSDPDHRKSATAVVFLWDESLRQKSTNFGRHFSMPDILDLALGVKKQDIEAPAEILNLQLPGDWVIRAGASEESVLREMQTILNKEFEFSVQMSFAKRVRTVYVARGKYKYTPVDSKEFEDDPKRSDLFDDISFYGRTPIPNIDASGNCEFPELMAKLSEWIGVPIVSEVTEPSLRMMKWRMHGPKNAAVEQRKQDHDPEQVLKNFTAQTGLTFKKEYRPVRRLLVEPIEK